MKEEILVAKILRPHGIKGAIKISPRFSDIPFSKFKNVLVGKNRVPMNVIQVMLLNQFYSIRLDKISSCEDAENYRNQDIFVSTNDYPTLVDELVTISDYIGSKVYDENNNLVGVVVDVDNYGSADIISINCNGSTYMVPYIEDTIHFDKSKEIFIIDSRRFLEIRV